MTPDHLERYISAVEASPHADDEKLRLCRIVRALVKVAESAYHCRPQISGSVNWEEYVEAMDGLDAALARELGEGEGTIEWLDYDEHFNWEPCPVCHGLKVVRVDETEERREART